MRSFKLDYGAEQIFGGHLLGVRSLTGLSFYDWTRGTLVRRIEINPRLVYWNESGELVALCTNDTFFVLRYLADEVPSDAHSASNNVDDLEGYEKAFEVSSLVF